jgi:hypothetical protein
VRWADAITLARRSVQRRPGRAALTVLAVSLGAALLTALLTIATTAETKVLDQLAKGGPLSGIRVAAAEPDPLQAGEDNAQPGRPRDLDDHALESIRALPGVRAALPVVATDVFVVEPTTTPANTPLDPFTDTLVGVDLDRPSLLPVTVLFGRSDAGCNRGGRSHRVVFATARTQACGRRAGPRYRGRVRRGAHVRR